MDQDLGRTCLVYAVVEALLLATPVVAQTVVTEHQKVVITTAAPDTLVVDINVLVVDGTNNRVGIGTTSPDNTLHVHKITAGSVSANANSALVIENNTAVHIELITPDGTTDHGILWRDVAAIAGSIVYDHTANDLSFSTSDNTIKMTIDSSGNVGIGNISPDAPLHVGATLDFTPAEAGLLVRKNAATATNTNQAARFELHQTVLGAIVAYGSESRVDAEHTTGTLNVIVGAKGSAFVDGNGITTTVIGVEAQVGRLSGTGTATNARAVLATNAGGAYATNAYGLYVDAQTGSTNNFAIFTNAGIVSLAGNVGLGDTTPTQTLDVTGTFGFADVLLMSSTAPTISSGFGTSPTVPNANGTAAFTINVGTGGTATAGIIALPTAATGWNCFVQDITSNLANDPEEQTVQTASSTTTASIESQNISTGAAAAWTASDILGVSCFAY